MAARPFLFAFIFTAILLPRAWGQRASAPTPAPAASQAQSQPPQQASDPLAEMRADLNRLDSLNSVMSSQVEFLHDQNLQMLLRNNSQMWAVLIRELRRQIDREERLRGRPAADEEDRSRPEQK